MKKLQKKLFFLALALLTTITTTAYGAGYLSPEVTPLTEKEKRILKMIRTWSDMGDQVYMQAGKLVYVHGAAGGIPTIIAAPLQVVDVELEPGESVNEIVVGDSARWQVESGSAGRSTHLFIKPIDVGLESSAVVTTNRRVYHLRLISRKTDFTPYVGFAYAADLQAQLITAKAQEQKTKTWQTTDKGVDLSQLNFGYDVEGSAPWKPEQVFDDGRKMYIQLPSSAQTGEIPALMVKKGRKEVLVNYRVKGLTMEVDGLFPHLALVVGVGSSQELVEIYKKGTRQGYYSGPSFVKDDFGGGR